MEPVDILRCTCWGIVANKGMYFMGIIKGLYCFPNTNGTCHGDLSPSLSLSLSMYMYVR